MAPLLESVRDAVRAMDDKCDCGGETEEDEGMEIGEVERGEKDGWSEVTAITLALYRLHT